MENWVKLENRTPDSGWYLVYADGAINCMMFDNGEWYDPTYAELQNITIGNITHWQKLVPPQEED